MLSLPEYTGRADETVENVQGALEIVEGTAVILRVELADRGADPLLQCAGELRSGAKCVGLESDGPGRRATPPLRPGRSVDYELALTDGYGQKPIEPKQATMETGFGVSSAGRIALRMSDSLTVAGSYSCRSFAGRFLVFLWLAAFAPLRAGFGGGLAAFLLVRFLAGPG